MKTFLYRVRSWKLASSITLGFVALIWSIPTIGLLITSFRTKDSATASGWWDAILHPFNQAWTVSAYQTVLTRDGMFDALIHTIVVAVPATILPVLIAANAAFAFSFIEFKGREVLFGVLVGLMVIPLQAALVPALQGIAWLNENLGINVVGDYPAVWLMHSAFAMPLAIYILRNYMMTLPVALIEAARVDGASYYQIFWRLVMPMSVPALASFAIFQFLWVWNDYLIAFIFLSDQKAVLSYKLFTLMGQYGDGWQDVAAGSFITLIVPLIVFFSLQRYFVRGLTAGAVK
jgi:alpha-glucoside transport system permease protein